MYKHDVAISVGGFNFRNLYVAFCLSVWLGEDRKGNGKT
jgi:hypothetical protein